MIAALFSSLRMLLALLLAGMSLGCDDPKRRAEKALSRADIQEMRRDAALLCKELFAGHGSEFKVVRPQDWPRSFRPLNPIRVGAYPDGISLALKASSAAESGVYIVPWRMDVVPSLTHGTRFQPVAEGVYWYSFGD